MPDYRTDRIAVLVRELSRLDQPAIMSARRAYLRARDELSLLVRVGAPADVVQATRYRVERAQQTYTALLHPATA